MSDEVTLFHALTEAAETNRHPDEVEAEIWERFGETRAVLVLDSTGFSLTTKRRGVVYYLSLLARMRAVGLEVFSSHGALEMRAEADNLFAVFEKPDQALAAALEMHHRIALARLKLDEAKPYRVCIGIGYGRLLRSAHEGMFGDQMNLASKLGEDTAMGGETLITSDAFESLEGHDGYEVERRFIEIAGVELPYFAVTSRR